MSPQTALVNGSCLQTDKCSALWCLCVFWKPSLYYLPALQLIDLIWSQGWRLVLRKQAFLLQWHFISFSLQKIIIIIICNSNCSTDNAISCDTHQSRLQSSCGAHQNCQPYSAPTHPPQKKMLYVAFPAQGVTVIVSCEDESRSERMDYCNLFNLLCFQPCWCMAWGPFVSFRQLECQLKHSKGSKCSIGCKHWSPC